MTVFLPAVKDGLAFVLKQPPADGIAEDQSSTSDLRIDPMKRFILSLPLCALVACVSVLAESWPQWRGPSRDGVSTETGLPTQWSATENVAWKLPLRAFSAGAVVHQDRRAPVGGGAEAEVAGALRSRRGPPVPARHVVEPRF
jgi:hypothetical protein